MAELLADVATLAADTTFRARVAAGICYKAGFIGTEVLAMSEPGAIDKLRLQLAKIILSDAGETVWTDTFVWALASAPSITGSSDDSAILSAIDDFWNLLAGVTV